MSTIKQVADQAGVSVATVSRVINKTGYVSLDLQERVQEAMRTLNYQPSALARSLRRQETQTVGVLVPQLDHPFFSTLAFAIEKTLFGEQYRTFICSSEENQDKEDSYIEMLLRQRVDGVILVPTGKSTRNVQRLVDQKIPVVLADRDVSNTQINRVLCDNECGSYNGMKHLLSLGHRQVGLVGGPLYSGAMAQRIAGARRALQEAGIHDAMEILTEDNLQQFEIGFAAADELLSRPVRPTAIFALTDVMAVGVLHAAAARELNVPRDLSVMGFDNIPLAAFSFPELTTVAQPIYKMGETAAQILLRHMTDDEESLQTVVLDTEIIIRKSVDSPGA